jgi:predicted nucleic acid-binding protein
MIVADTDVLIDALRGREPAASRVVTALTEGTLATTAITAFELRSGARTAEEIDLVEALLAGLPVLPFDDGAAKAAGSCRRGLEALGSTIGMGDYLIAGICLSRGAPLLTRNRKHFERVPELLLGML